MQQIQFPHRHGFKKIFAPQILLQACCSCNMTIWASTLFSTCLRRAFFLHHADSDANTCNKYNFLTGLGSKRSSHHRFCPNMLLMQHTIWASTLFSTCPRRTFCLHHADSDANTCNKYNFLTGMGSRKSSHHRFCSKHAVHATWQFGHLPSSVHASEEHFFCTMQIQTLIHATNTISSQAWAQKDLHTTDSVQTCCSCNIRFGHLPSSVHASEEPFVCIMQIQTLIHATNTISSQAWVQEDLRTTDFAPSMLFMQHDNLGIYPLQYMPQKNLLSASCRFRC